MVLLRGDVASDAGARPRDCESARAAGLAESFVLDWLSRPGAAAESFARDCVSRASDVAFFATPPWCEHAPRPAFDVVPSLHSTCAASFFDLDFASAATGTNPKHRAANKAFVRMDLMGTSLSKAAQRSQRTRATDERVVARLRSKREHLPGYPTSKCLNY